MSHPSDQPDRAVDFLARRLYEAGCRQAFGMPGGEVLTLVDALQNVGIECVLARHENAAAFMAEAAWHRTGAPGILIGQAAGGLVFGLLAWWLAARVIENAGHEVPHDPFGRQARLMSLLHLRR